MNSTSFGTDCFISARYVSVIVLSALQSTLLTSISHNSPYRRAINTGFLKWSSSFFQNAELYFACRKCSVARNTKYLLSFELKSILKGLDLLDVSITLAKLFISIGNG